MIRKIKGKVVNKYTNPASYGGGYFIVIRKINKPQTVVLETTETLFNTINMVDQLTITPYLFTNKIKSLKKEGVYE